MQDDHVEAPIDRIRDPVTSIEFRQSRLRHDHAIESVDAAALRRAAKGERNHTVRQQGSSSVKLFVAVSGYLGYAPWRPGCKQNDWIETADEAEHDAFAAIFGRRRA